MRAAAQSTVPRQRRTSTSSRRSAAQHGFNSFVTFLVEHGADLQAKDATGRTALDMARGTGVAGRGQAEAFPETAKLIEKLMADKGLVVPPVPAPARQAAQ